MDTSGIDEAISFGGTNYRSIKHAPFTVWYLDEAMLIAKGEQSISH